MKKRVCIFMLGVMAITQTQFAYADGIFGDLKDIASGVAQEVTGELAVEEIFGDTGDIWGDLQDELWSSFSADLSEELEGTAITDLYSDTLSWLNISGDNALETFEDIFMGLTIEMGMSEKDSAEIWNKVMDFAEENNIDGATIAKLSISSIVTAKAEEGFAKEQAKDYITETIASWILNSIDSQEDAEKALEEQGEKMKEQIEE